MPLYPHERETASIMALAPVIPVLTVASVEDGLAQAKALVAGGLYAIEVTLRTPSALEAIKAIAKNVPKAVVGAGTIVSADQINQAVAAGAKFLVSPGAPAALAKAAAQSPVPFLPGCATASEAMALTGAWLPGAEALSRRSRWRGEAARLACGAPAGSALLPDRRHRSSEGAGISEASERALRRRVVDVAEGGACGGGLSRGRSAVARRGGARTGGRVVRHREPERMALDWLPSAPLASTTHSAKLEARASGCENPARRGLGHRDDFPTY